LRFGSDAEQNRAHGSKSAARESSTSPGRLTGQQLHPGTKQRTERLAEQGWVEKRGIRRQGITTSWSIKRIDTDAPPKVPKPATSEPQIRLRQPTPSKSNTEAAKFLSKYGGRALNELDGDRYINGLSIEEHNQAMAELARKNDKDTRFQDRFERMLAKHEGRKVPADSGNMDHEGGNYDADTSNVSEMGIEHEWSRDETMADVAAEKYNFNFLDERFAKEQVEHNQKRVLAEASRFYSEGSNNNADMSSFGAAPRRHRSSETKSQRLAQQEDKGQKQNLREWKKETVYDDQGNVIPRWVKILKDGKKARKQARDERREVEAKGHIERDRSEMAVFEVWANVRFMQLKTNPLHQAKGMRSRNGDVSHDDDGNLISRWPKNRITAGKKEIRQREEFEQRFNEVLAKHDGKKNQNDDGRMDFEMGHEGTSVEDRNDYGSKRKRQDEDELMESMGYIPAKTGRKR
jgi:hypothetical protein